MKWYAESIENLYGKGENANSMSPPFPFWALLLMNMVSLWIKIKCKQSQNGPLHTAILQ